MNTEVDVKTLFESIAKGDSSKIEQLLQSIPALADVTNKQGVSALVFALYYEERILRNYSLRQNASLSTFSRLPP